MYDFLYLISSTTLLFMLQSIATQIFFTLNSTLLVTILQFY